MSKTILITGATDGIGKHLAKKLASEGHEVIIHGRNPEKIKNTINEITSLNPEAKVKSYKADFSKTEEVYVFAENIKTDFTKIDVLFNNAGLYAGKERKETKEGVELTFMLSVQVPYILATELLPLLENSNDGRIINTSSFMHHFANVGKLDFSLEKKYSPGLAYNNSKLYTIWLTKILAQKYQLNKNNVSINAYHPGLISTNLGNDTSDEKVKNSLYGRFMKAMSKNLDEGIETGYYLALSDEVTGVTGSYFDDKKLKRVSEKNYTEEKGKKLLEYCDSKIKMIKTTKSEISETLTDRNKKRSKD